LEIASSCVKNGSDVDNNSNDDNDIDEAHQKHDSHIRKYVSF
jgi:hypothetical protein